MWNSSYVIRCPKCKGMLYINDIGYLVCEDCGTKAKAELKFDKCPWKDNDKDYLYLNCKEVEE